MAAAARSLRERLTSETTGGALLLIAALLGLGWANSPWREAYLTLSRTVIGVPVGHLELPVAAWASDGVLVIFFFVVGVELKHELVAGSLRNLRTAAVPVLAAVGGMVVPALLFTGLVVGLSAPEAVGGWAIPTATDIAFALAVLAVFGRGLPRVLRVFLLTLAVVDDLLGILVIATVYTDELDLLALVGAAIAIGAFAWMVRSRRPRAWLLVPLALIAWGFMHASGVHATIAGVALGFCVPALAVHGERDARTHAFDEAIRPFSAGVALPVFAFFAAGVDLADGAGPAAMVTEPVFVATVTALVAGKVIGVLGTTALVTGFTGLRLPDAIGLRDLLPVSLLTGIGFTVSLLISELSFDAGPLRDSAKLGILIGSLLAGVLGAAALRWDARRARDADMNRDGIPDSDIDTIG